MGCDEDHAAVILALHCDSNQLLCMQGGNVLKLCAGCGAQVPEGSKFCNICGKTLAQEIKTIPSPHIPQLVPEQPTGGIIERAKKYKSFNAYIVLVAIFLLIGIASEGISGAFLMMLIINFFWMFYAIIWPRSGTFGFVSSRIGAGIIFGVVFVCMGMLSDSTKTSTQKLKEKSSAQTQMQQDSKAFVNKVASMPIVDLDKKAEENDALFSSTYANKTLELSGKIDEIRFEDKQVKISFKGTKSFLYALFPEDEASLFAKIAPGQVITFRGTVKRDIARYNCINSTLIEPINKYQVMEFKPYALFEYLYKENKGATINQKIILIKNAEIQSITQSDDKMRKTITLILASGWRHPQTYGGRLEIQCTIKNNQAESAKFYALKAGNQVSISGKFVYKDTNMYEIGRNINWNFMSDCEIIQ